MYVTQKSGGHKYGKLETKIRSSFGVKNFIPATYNKFEYNWSINITYYTHAACGEGKCDTLALLGWQMNFPNYKEEKRFVVYTNLVISVKDEFKKREVVSVCFCYFYLKTTLLALTVRCHLVPYLQGDY